MESIIEDGVMVDIMFECANAAVDKRRNPTYKALIGECWARHKAYKEIGYDVTLVDNLDAFPKLLKGAHD